MGKFDVLFEVQTGFLNRVNPRFNELIRGGVSVKAERMGYKTAHSA
jgi:hypothetical protein